MTSSIHYLKDNHWWRKFWVTFHQYSPDAVPLYIGVLFLNFMSKQKFLLSKPENITANLHSLMQIRQALIDYKSYV